MLHAPVRVAPCEARALSSRGCSARPAACARPAGARRAALRVRAGAAPPGEGETFDPRAFRRTLGQSENYTRKHLRDEDAAKAMEDQGVGAISAGACAAGLVPWPGLPACAEWLAAPLAQAASSSR